MVCVCVKLRGRSEGEHCSHPAEVELFIVFTLCVPAGSADAAKEGNAAILAEVAEEVRRAGVKQKVLEHVRYVFVCVGVGLE